MSIEAIMTRTVHFCSDADTLNRAAQLMWEQRCGCLPVVNGRGDLAGVITDRDICMAAYTRGQPLHQLRVADAMARPTIVCRPEDSIECVERLMARHHVRRLPVMGARGELVGIVSRADLDRFRSRDQARAAGSRA